MACVLLWIFGGMVIGVSLIWWCALQVAKVENALEELSQFVGEADEPPYMKKRK